MTGDRFIFLAIGPVLDGLRAYPLRTALSIFGVVIGVTSLVATLAIGAGASENATEGIRELGANLLFVRPGKPVLDMPGWEMSIPLNSAMRRHWGRFRG